MQFSMNSLILSSCLCRCQHFQKLKLSSASILSSFFHTARNFPISTCTVRSFSSKDSSRAEDLNKIHRVAEIIEAASKILVMTGAGLSTPSGIPDFRSPGTGLYDNLQKFNLPFPEAIFDIDYFMMDSKPFFTLAQELYPGVQYQPNAGHFFLYLLLRNHKLHKLYTQNIDGLERLAGIPDEKLCESHGTFFSASCTLCGEKHDVDKVKDAIVGGETPIICKKNHCKGKVKPDIVFFGENLPSKFWNFKEDVKAIEVLLVIGTSLEVYPFASIADAVPDSVQRILINRDPVGSFGQRPNDILCTGDLIDTIYKISMVLKWDASLRHLVELSKSED